MLLTGTTWGISIVTSLRAYQLGNVTIIAPLCALTVMLNVIVGYLFLKERDHLVHRAADCIDCIGHPDCPRHHLVHGSRTNRVVESRKHPQEDRQTSAHTASPRVG